MSLRSCCGLKACAALLALSLAACGSLTSDQRGGFILPPDLGLNNLMALPQPFRIDHKDLPLTFTTMGRTDVAVPQIADLPATSDHAIKAALTQVADDADILILDEMPDRPTYVLEGIAKRSGGVLTINWHLHNPQMHLVKSFDASVPLSDSAAGAVGSRTARELANQTIAALSQTLGTTGGVMTEPAQRSSAAAEPPKIYIGGVAGAPGDGNRSLPAALKLVLGQDGAPLTADSAKADFTLAGKVALKSPEQDKQDIAITWQVIDRNGVIAGQITQSNEIKAGSLDGNWGQIAFDIALAAEGGLGDMLSEIEARRAGLVEDDPHAGPVIPDVVLHRHVAAPPAAPPAVGKLRAP